MSEIISNITDALMASIETVLWLPIAGLHTIAAWFVIAYDTWPQWVLWIGGIFCFGSYCFMVYVNYKEVEQEKGPVLLSGIYGSFLRTIRQYFRAFLMPVTPYIPFLKQILRSTTPNEKL